MTDIGAALHWANAIAWCTLTLALAVTLYGVLTNK
jgi:hypothetical protein